MILDDFLRRTEPVFLSQHRRMSFNYLETDNVQANITIDIAHRADHRNRSR